MKLITNSITILALATGFLAGCRAGNAESEVNRTNEQILQEVTEVNAIGKVVPASDWAIISSPVAARIRHLLVQAGDTVSAGQPLIQLESGTADLDIQEARARLAGLRAENKMAHEDLIQAQLRSAELKATYETSQRLLAQHAETQEKTDTDYSAWQQQQSVVKSMEQQLIARRASENEQSIGIEKTEKKLSDFQITAPQAGIITDFVGKVGQYVSGSEELGRIADTGHPIVEAEVDELFAGDVQVGQSVFVLATGRPDTLARGRISYTSPVLSDKSILYETANEGEDRRVRRIKIEADSPVSLTLNAKVTCKIKIR